MDAIENSLSKFQAITPNDIEGLDLLNPSASKFICTASHLPGFFEHISDTFRILETEGKRILFCQNPFCENVGAEKPEIGEKCLGYFVEEKRFFNEYKRILLTNFNEWITIDFCLQHISITGRLSLFDSMVVLSVYTKRDLDSLPLIKLLENFIATEGSYFNSDINLLQLYSLVKLNMSKSKIRILKDFIQ